MTYARQMLDSCPPTVDVDAGVLAAAIDAISDCAQACAATAPACLCYLTDCSRCLVHAYP